MTCSVKKKIEKNKINFFLKKIGPLHLGFETKYTTRQCLVLPYTAVAANELSSILFQTLGHGFCSLKGTEFFLW